MDLCIRLTTPLTVDEHRILRQWLDLLDEQPGEPPVERLDGALVIRSTDGTPVGEDAAYEIVATLMILMGRPLSFSISREEARDHSTRPAVTRRSASLRSTRSERVAVTQAR